MIYFYYPHIYTGGAETLIYRIAAELKKRNIPAKVVSKECGEIMRNLFREAQIDLTVDETYVIKPAPGDTIFVFSLIDYLRFNLRTVGKKAKVILYMVGVYTLTVRRLHRYPVILRLTKPLISRSISKAIRRNSIIFMDRIGIAQTEKYYGVDYKLEDEALLPLPIDTFELDKAFCRESAKDRNPFSILTIARADFPFKGYIKGLIEECAELGKRYPIHLTVVSYGKDINQLQSWIESAKNVGFSDITLIGETPYYELIKYILRSNLYIGMGTTVLDAASRGIITIAVQSYTYALKANCFFWEEPDRLGVDPKEESAAAGVLIEKVINMPEDEYISAMEKTEAALRRCYSMDSFMEKFLSITGNSVRQ